ncbi:MAG TPA: aminotransferase class V-fold PLP-dependent enzyme [Spirochaetia bacterium]|nr:aminotransferase class V-fold PLP-dependent enzyme [Spirochaetia bacterium]
MQKDDFWDEVRRGIIGGDAVIDTPFGRRRVTYADHTASGRAVTLVEDRIRAILETYGNTHTEDDATGGLTSGLLHEAEARIKKLVNAGPRHKIVAVGAGTTAAVHHLQQILGIYLPPAGRAMFQSLLREHLPAPACDELIAALQARRPVVFVGPYEHHSNEVSWRECFAEVVEIELTADGRLDLEDLRAKVSDPAWGGRRRIGAFSAASNVSGVTTPVYDVARILHQNDALAFFDFAAAAPYVEMDMRRDTEAEFDALYFSPHKFLGGPGSSGVLIFHERIYRRDLAPTVGAGGTVDYVSFDDQAYSEDVEVREKAGTPGILQTIRAALAMELKERLGQSRIEQREADLTRRAQSLLCAHPSIELMGGVEPEEKLPIFSFNIRVGPSWLHPRFVTTLLNDLFGIQSRAGCSCAAPYGHRLLHIDPRKSAEFRRTIACGNVGLKPGWTRVNFHFLHTDAEVDFLCRAILFVAEHGKEFLPLYRFDMRSGSWKHASAAPMPAATRLFVDAADRPAAREPGTTERFQQYLREAEERAASLRSGWSDGELKTTEKDLIPFVYV